MNNETVFADSKDGGKLPKSVCIEESEKNGTNLIKE
jgi:hypothetical protein